MVRIGLAMLLYAALFGGCAPGGSGDPLDPVSEDYVKLALAIGRHDDNFVDAYYGPEAWRTAAESGEPRPPQALLEEARRLLGAARAAPDGERRRYLEKQLIAVEAFLRTVGGARLGLADEARLIYDIEIPQVERAELDAALAEVDRLVPGDGELPERVQAFRRRFQIPPDRVEPVVRTALEHARSRTAERVELPDGERFRFELVSDKPWSGYNWYQGGLESLIQLNTDLPSELSPLLGTMAHESYPGHHTYNAMIEQELVRGRGWREFTIYVLYSPQSVIAEGTANAGAALVLDPDARLQLMRDELCALAELSCDDAERYLALLHALDRLKYVRGEAARMLLDDGASEQDAVDFMMRYGLVSEDRARKSVDFIRTYRAYVYNYTVGEDLVRAYIGDGDDRFERFFGLLSRPVTPSDLR